MTKKAIDQRDAIAPGTTGDPYDPMDDFPLIRDAGEDHPFGHPGDDDPRSGFPNAKSRAEFENGNGSNHVAIDDGGFGRTAPIPRKKSLVAFPMLQFKDVHMDLTRRNYLVKGLFPRSGLAVIWGPPKCYKSFWSMDVALHIARGRPYRGLRVQQGPIVYVMLEGREGLGARKEALARHYEIGDNDDVPLYFITTKLDLAKQAPALERDIKAQYPDINPAGIVLDTLNRSLVGSESKDEDMAAYLAGAQHIEQAFNCLVAMVHHCGYDVNRMRGHSSLPAAIAVQLRVERPADFHVLVTVMEAKDIPEGLEIASRLEKVELGRDADGDQETSLVVIPLDPNTLAPTKAKAHKLTKSQRALVDAINEALDNSGETITPRAGMAAVRAVKVADVRKEFDRRYAASDPDKKSNTKLKAFGRGLEWLPIDQYGTAAVNDTDWIWRIKRVT